MNAPAKKTTAPANLRSLDDDVAAVLQLTDEIETLQSQLVAAKARLAERGVGKHQTSTGLTVNVTEPARSFDLEKAWDLLTPEQQAVCQSPDSKKIRQQLPPVLAEQCMRPGTGRLMVRIS